MGKKTSGSGTIRFRTFLHNTVFDVMKSRGWKETDSETEWDLTWADIGWMREMFDHSHLEEGQKVNHFRNHYELTRKDLLIKNLKRAKKQAEREDRYDEAALYDCSPPTYVLPSEYGLFVEEFKRYPGAFWIMKPIGKAQGKGIFLFNKLSQISDWKKDNRWKSDTPQAETYIVQKYLENPYLIGGKKFDCRLYALVTCYNPLTIWFYRGGFARFSNHRYTLSSKDMANTYIHLTNVSVQKTADNYNANAGCKWDINALKMSMISRHGNAAVNKSFMEVQQIIVRSLMSVQRTIINDKHCFELYGFDIIFDSNLRPWLLEVNASPSLTAETPYDYNLKFGLLDDMFSILDLEKRLKGNEEQVGGFDLIWKDGDVKNEHGISYLGCYNDRVRQLRRLQKQNARANALANQSGGNNSAQNSSLSQSQSDLQNASKTLSGTSRSSVHESRERHRSTSSGRSGADASKRSRSRSAQKS